MYSHFNYICVRHYIYHFFIQLSQYGFIGLLALLYVVLSTFFVTSRHKLEPSIVDALWGSPPQTRNKVIWRSLTLSCFHLTWKPFMVVCCGLHSWSFFFNGTEVTEWYLCTSLCSTFIHIILHKYIYFRCYIKFIQFCFLVSLLKDYTLVVLV